MEVNNIVAENGLSAGFILVFTIGVKVLGSKLLLIKVFSPIH